MRVYIPNLQMGELKHSISQSYGIIQQSSEKSSGGSRLLFEGSQQ